MRATWKSLSCISLGLAAATLTLPAIAAECTDLNLFAALDVKMLPSGRPAVEGMIGDRPETFLIDTGGVISMLTPRAVHELNLTTVRARDRVAMAVVSGARSDQMVQLPSITVGRYHQDKPYFYVLPGKYNPDDKRQPEFAGIIAPDFLQHFDVDFDFAVSKLNLISQDHCDGKVVYWQAPAVAVVPMQLDRGGHIKFQMQLDGTKVNAALDTGASSTTMNLTVARQAFHIDVDAPDVVKIGELRGRYTANIYRRRFKSLAFEGVTIINPMIDLLPDLLSGANPGTPRTGSIIREEKALPDVILGMSTLSQLHLYVAYQERKVYITAAGPPAAPAPPPASP
jgi:predicted aspartyl protease